MDAVKLPPSSKQALATVLERWKPVGRSGLLPALIEAQELFGWLSPAILAEIALGLNVPLSDAYGVADFYAHLYTRPVGKIMVRVCDDVSCYLAGSEQVCAAAEKQLKIREGEMTPDGRISFEIVSCLGHCDHGPVVMVGTRVHEEMTDEKAANLFGTLIEQTPENEAAIDPPRA